MARPTKCRRICSFPETLAFLPAEKNNKEPVILSIDEFEVIRLIDREGLSQKETAAQMGIGRTTAQKIYDTARKKIALVLTEGSPLKIEGGDIRLCNGEGSCYQSTCPQKEFLANYNLDKGEKIMRIAVTYENGQIFQHFGHTGQFKIYDVDDGKIVSSKVLDTNGQGHGALAGVLSAIQADVLICGGIGGGAQMALASAGIKLYGGVSGNADEAVNAFIAGNLDFNPNVRCNHHEHGEGHTCGEHRCGKGNCGNH